MWNTRRHILKWPPPWPQKYARLRATHGARQRPDHAVLPQISVIYSTVAAIAEQEKWCQKRTRIG